MDIKGKLERLLTAAARPYHPSRFYESELTPPETTRQFLECLVRAWRDNWARGIVPLSISPFATHLPVLVTLARLVRMKRVLELGSGLYSTPAFLDPTLFPHLRRLDSTENDLAWAEQVAAAVSSDRWRLHRLAGATSEALSQFDLDSYDLILVDDATTREARARTIATLAGLTTIKRPIFVIHDFECPLYRRAASGFSQVIRLDGVEPNVGVAAHRTKNVPSAALHELNRYLRRQGAIDLSSRASLDAFLTRRVVGAT